MCARQHTMRWNLNVPRMQDRKNAQLVGFDTPVIFDIILNYTGMSWLVSGREFFNPLTAQMFLLMISLHWEYLINKVQGHPIGRL